MLRLRTLLLGALAAAGAGARADAQDIGIRAARRDTIRAASTVTATFLVSNRGDDTVVVQTQLELPPEWTALTGSDSVRVAPRSSELLILSIVVPGRTLAGIYPVRVSANGSSDAVIVRVPDRIATEVSVLDRPGYVVSGRAYETGFQVRNRGNRVSDVRLAARSSVGAVALSDTVLRLAPGEAREVRARVRTPAGMNVANDDVVELLASHAGAEGAEAVRGSSRVTVVPEPTRAIEQFLRIPARVNLRAASADGVSPFEAFGQGLVRDGGEARLDFMFRGPAGTSSAFGERDEYRIELRAPAWRVRGGDQVFMLSPLTAGGQPGFGFGADGDLGMLSAGAYAQRFRRVPEQGDERGAFLGARPFEGANLSLNAVHRVDGALPGTIGSASAFVERSGISSELEYARSSSSGSGMGEARNARVSGSSPFGAFDVGHLYADTAFAGSQRGGEHNYLSASAVPVGIVSFGFNGSLHRTDLSRSTGVPYLERFRTAAVTATVLHRFTVEAGTVSRGTVISGVRQDGHQRSLRARADHDFEFGTLSLEAEGGESDAAGRRRSFHEAGLGARKPFRWGHASVYGQRYSGGGITKGAEGSRTIGGDASVRVGGATHASLIAYATRQETAGAGWHSQLDALVSRGLPNGAILTLRARLLSGGSRTGDQQSLMYLEYGMPMRLPIAPLRTPGRVTGRVVDAASGRGVPGALVRLGPQVAITDRNGAVSFGGVPGGQHRLSMSQEASFANAVFVGDPTLVVDSTRVTPTTFSLAIARSARIDVDVRRFTLTRTVADAGADSLREAGGVSNATLVLSGERDTLYRSTGEDGRATFTDVPPGQWVLTVRGDTPAFTRFDPDRLELTLEPGEREAAQFRLVPRRREIQIIGGDQELQATPSEPRSAPVPAPRTASPDVKRPDGQR